MLIPKVKADVPAPNQTDCHDLTATVINSSEISDSILKYDLYYSDKATSEAAIEAMLEHYQPLIIQYETGNYPVSVDSVNREDFSDVSTYDAFCDNLRDFERMFLSPWYRVEVYVDAEGKYRPIQKSHGWRRLQVAKRKGFKLVVHVNYC